MKPEIAIAHYKLGKLSPKEIVSIANKWLEEGIYTDSINFLTMEHEPIMADVGPLLEKAILELDLNLPDKLTAARVAAIDTARNMLSGQVELLEGANFLYWEIHHEVTDIAPDKEYIGDNLGLEHVFCWLREIWDCRDGSRILYYTDLTRDRAELKFFEHLKEETEKWLAEKA